MQFWRAQLTSFACFLNASCSIRSLYFDIHFTTTAPTNFINFCSFIFSSSSVYKAFFFPLSLELLGRVDLLFSSAAFAAATVSASCSTRFFSSSARFAASAMTSAISCRDGPTFFLGKGNIIRSFGGPGGGEYRTDWYRTG